MSFSTIHRDAAVGVALLGVSFAVGVYIDPLSERKRYFLFRRRKSQKIFEGQDDPRRAYLLRLSLREHPGAKKLRQRLSGITPHSVSSDAAQLLGNLARLMKSQRILDIDPPPIVTTGRLLVNRRSCGYNPLVLALVLPLDGKLTASFCETENYSYAKESWKEVGVDKKIHMEVKSAEQILDDLLSAGEAGRFDLISINMADEQNCRSCYEKSLRLVRNGGILAIDGVLCYGAVLKNGTSAAAQAMHQLNQAILRDARVALSILPVGDGLMLCFKL